MTYGERTACVKEWRQARFLSQRQLADAAGVSRETIINVEAGKPLRVSTLQRLATALGVTPDDLFRLPQDVKESAR